MLYWAVAFFIVAIFSGLSAVFGLAPVGEGMTKIFFSVFLVLAIVGTIASLRPRGSAF